MQRSWVVWVLGLVLAMVATALAVPTGCGVEGSVGDAGGGGAYPGQGWSNPLPGVVVLVFDAQGREVARQRTGADGHFKIDISPGVYSVCREGEKPAVPGHFETYTGGYQQNIQVVSGKYTLLRLWHYAAIPSAPHH
ncbi:MAG: hypothetical protein ACYCW6_08785 [Candidatus Xenobia bacterium]